MSPANPVIASAEAGERWLYCYSDDDCGVLKRLCQSFFLFPDRDLQTRIVVLDEY